MSRYRVRLVPQGVIPRPVEFGVRMTRVVEPGEVVEPGCCNECGVFAVTIDGDPATGELFSFQNDTPDPVNIRVEHLGGVLCPGACIEWTIRPLFDGADILTTEAHVTADGCAAVDILLDHTDVFDWLQVWFALDARIDGEPFCRSLIFSTITPSLGCSDTRGTLATSYSTRLDGPTPPQYADMTDGAPGFFPAATFIPFALDFADTNVTPGAPVCNSNLTADLAFFGGDPLAYGDFSVLSWSDIGSADVGFRLVATGANDYTGITITLSAKWNDDSTAFSAPVNINAA